MQKNAGKPAFFDEAESTARENKERGSIQMKFYKVDGKIVIGENLSGEEITANTTDGAYEKHVPMIEQTGDHVTVNVGSVAHPMLEAHYIEWIVLETMTGYHLKPGEAPEASFAVTEPIIAAYEYCNLHGLWMAKP